MHDIMFFEDEENLARLPPDVRITQVQVRPLPDGKRVVVQVTLTPFIEQPSFDVTLLRPDGNVERSVSVISAMDRTNSLTLHLSRPERASEYIARIDLIHEGAVLQTRQVRFSVPDEATAH